MSNLHCSLTNAALCPLVRLPSLSLCEEYIPSNIIIKGLKAVYTSPLADLSIPMQTWGEVAKSSKWHQEDSKPGSLDCESDSLTAAPPRPVVLTDVSTAVDSGIGTMTYIFLVVNIV